MIIQTRYYQRTFLFLAAALLASSVYAQQPPVVPRDSAEVTIAGKRISISYGRPSMHGRRIMGDYVPYNRIWRTGSGKSTTLVTDADLEIGGMEIPRGGYSLYTFPTEGQWKLIVNKQTGQWGTIYNPQQDLARITMEKRTLSTPMERLTFVLERAGNSSGILKIEWERTSVSLPFKVSPVPVVASPRDSSTVLLGGTSVTVNYGSPSARGRKIMGGVVPYNRVWRTGANETTTFTTGSDLSLGGAIIPKGTYSLYTLPSKSSWQLIINKKIPQSGLEYYKKYDLARVKLKKQALSSPLERLTITLKSTNSHSGSLLIAWEKTSLSIPFSLKGF
ncbi:MAG TPA: hypothetical protein DEP53_04425 [Bacteroidetes bacterium]|nr:hypothetical protein [Bacteroidota bacterium]